MDDNGDGWRWKNNGDGRKQMTMEIAMDNDEDGWRSTMMEMNDDGRQWRWMAMKTMEMDDNG